MASQTFRVGYGIEGMTTLLTLDVFPLAGGAAVASSLTLTVDADNPLLYKHTRTGTLSGWHICNLRDSGNLVVDNPWLVYLVNADGNYDLSYFASISALIGFINAGGLTLPAAGLDSIVIESGINLRQAIALIGAAVAGKLGGVDTDTPVFKGMDNNTTRISAVTDDTGRVTVTLTPPS